MEKIKGIVYTVLSSVAFGIMPILVKMAFGTGMNTINVLFWRFFFATAILYLYLIIKRVSLKIN